MPAKKPGYSVRLWVSMEDLEHLKKLSLATELTQVELMSRLLHSGIASVVESGYRLNLPLKFRMQESPILDGIEASKVPRRLNPPSK